MSREKLLSVIVPVYNVRAYLPRCVESILAQEVPLELILVDDGSRDGSGALCDGYAGADPRVRVLHKANGGLSSARNAGLDAATGDYVTFVDSDDWIEPGAYRAMLALLEQTGADLICGGRYDVDGPTGKRTPGLCPERTQVLPGQELAGRIFLWDGCDSSACDKICRRELFRDLRYPLGVTSEDVPVTYRLALKARQAVLWDRPFYNYFHRPGSITLSPVSERTLDLSCHTAAIYAHVRQACPAVAPQARFLRVRSLSHLLLRLELADGATRRRFRGAYRQARRALARHTGFFLTSRYFGPRERLRDLLLVLGLYRLVRPLFTSSNGANP